MTVVLDTNQLPQNGDPDALQLQVLKAVAAERDLQLAAPELVVTEWTAKVRRDAEAAWRQAGSALKNAARFGDVPDLPELDAAAVANDRRARLEAIIEVVPMPDGCWEEALRREANRIPPTREGSGARDAAIWLAALEHARAEEGPTYLVSRNTKDFSDPDDKAKLHPSLRAEVGDPPVLELVLDTEAMLNLLAKKLEAHFGVEGLAAIDAARSAVVLAIERGVLDTLDMPHLPPVGPRYVAAPPEVSPVAVVEERAFEVAGTRVTVVVARYEAAVTIGTLRRASSRGMSQLQVDARLELPVRLLIRGNDAGAEAELLSTGEPVLHGPN